LSESDNGSYWKSASGIAARLSDLSHMFSWSSLSEAMKGIFVSEPSAKKLIWRTWGDDKTCSDCDGLNGSEYTEEDPMLPEMPNHVLCRCWFDLEGPEGEQEIANNES
jgi:hypothetical protein